MAGILASRLVAWVILGGGALAAITMIYMGGAVRGASKENAKWQSVVRKAEEAQARANTNVNIGTISSDAELRQIEQEIKERWNAHGREGSK